MSSTSTTSTSLYPATGTSLVEVQESRAESLDFNFQESRIDLLMEKLLTKAAVQVLQKEGVSYAKLGPIQRLFLTHYRCSRCKLVPLYILEIKHPNKPRCGRCGQLVSFTSMGKYGRMRKKIVASFLLLKEPVIIAR